MVEREPTGRWVKGKSANPKGRPAILKDLRAAAQLHGQAAIDGLARIALNHRTPPQARVAAFKELLDRGYGRAPAADGEGAEQLVIKIQRFAEQVADAAINMKVIDHDTGDPGES